MKESSSSDRVTPDCPQDSVGDSDPIYDVEDTGERDGIDYKVFGNYNQFVGIKVYLPNAYHFKIRHEKFGDKLRKLLGAEYEFQTGNRKFDKKYFIVGFSEAYKEIIADKSLHTLIEALEPFKDLYVWEKSIYLECITRNENEFRSVDSKALVRKLIELSTTIKGI